MSIDREGAYRWLPYTLMGGGLLLVGVTVGELSFQLLQTDSIHPSFSGGIVTSLPFSLGVVAGGYWLSQSDLPPERYPRIMVWLASGFLFMGGFFLFIALVFWESVLVQLATVRWGVAVGAGGGLLIGLFEARAVENARIAERTNIRAEVKAQRQELLSYLNGLLRHEVLNTSNIIDGYADLLEDPDLDDDSQLEYARLVQQEASELSTITEDIRVLLQAAEGVETLDSRELTTIIEDELARLQNRHEAVAVETTMAEEVNVPGDELLRRIFSNLFANAVKHNDSDTPLVAVTMTTTDETVLVRIEDNGPGVPESKREDLFEFETTTGDDHGLGLAIVGMLADRYGGSVELTETGPDGSVFSVTLPLRAQPAADTPSSNGVQ